jgi:hypothetical protein
MRKVIGGAFISLDGVVQAPAGPEEDTTGGFAHGGWMEPVFDEAVGHQVDTLFAGDFDLLLGRRTSDIFAAYWPFMPNANAYAERFGAVDQRRAVSIGWCRSVNAISGGPSQNSWRTTIVNGIIKGWAIG